MVVDSAADSHGITHAFLTTILKEEALRKGVEDVPEVVSFKVVPGTKPGDNYMSLIYAIDLVVKDTTSGALQDRHFLIKCYPNHPQRQKFTNQTNMFHIELQVYSRYLSDLDRLQREVLKLDKKDRIEIPYPGFIHGECIDYTSPEGIKLVDDEVSLLSNYIVMEDMKKAHGYRMTNRREALDLDHMRLVVEALSKVHALSWAYRQHVEQDIVKKFPFFRMNLTDELMDQWRQVMVGNIDQAKGIYDEALGPGNDLSKGAEKFKMYQKLISDYMLGMIDVKELSQVFRVLPAANDTKFGKGDLETLEPWKIINHGDCWSNNMLFKYDPETKKPVSIILVDLQMPSETCVTNDLQYVMYSSTSRSFRKEHMSELLQLYHDKFNHHCKLLKTKSLPGFNIESLRYRFHLTKPFGCYMAYNLLPITLKEEEKVVNLEEMGEDVDVMTAFSDICSGGSGNSVYRDRIIGLAKDMFDDGIF